MYQEEVSIIFSFYGKIIDDDHKALEFIKL